MAYNYNPYNNNGFQRSQPYSLGYGAQPSMMPRTAMGPTVVVREGPHHHGHHHFGHHHHDHHHHDHHSHGFHHGHHGHHHHGHH